jgi:hypothetical protein
MKANREIAEVLRKETRNGVSRIHLNLPSKLAGAIKELASSRSQSVNDLVTELLEREIVTAWGALP